MRIIDRKIVSALIFSREGKLFQARKSKRNTATYPDCWHIPGGGVEEGETLLEALIREIQEELGFDISPYNPKLVDDSGTDESTRILKETGEGVLCKMKFSVFEVDLDIPADNVHITLDPGEFEEYQWIDPKELQHIKQAPPSMALFKRLKYL